MKRLHVHLSVQDLAESVSFYNALFGTPPAVQRDDYAKWMLEDPRVNFAVSQLGHAPGLDHLGIQVDSEEALQAMTGALRRADLAVIDEAATTCCYAQSEKGWVHDPQGIPWEGFFTRGEAATYGVSRSPRDTSAGTCCAPAARG